MLDRLTGRRYHFVFVTNDGVECSFRGTYLEVATPARTVATWRFEGWPDVEAVETMDLHAVGVVTTLTWVLTFRDAADRAHFTKTDGIKANLDHVGNLLKSLSWTSSMLPVKRPATG